ncbi:uncharacterized protein [Epargyreus clarus]|uniref:uncharacterized protein n=1 Tax=Epargyreus clarus TaxID=520877 RepID=UPI003C2ECE12
MSADQADVDALIAAVEKRPAIWNKSSEEYSDRLLKLKLWEEICEEIVLNWSELSSVKRRNVCTELQKKWRNLKDTFNKELAAQRKKDETGQGAKRKRLYIHFQALSFLASQSPIKRRSSNASHNSDDSENSEKEIVYALKRKRVSKERPGMNERTDIHDNDKEIEMPSQCQETTTYDEDVSFTEMLIPMLKKLNDDQKLYARIEILQIMNRAKFYCTPDYIGV